MLDTFGLSDKRDLVVPCVLSLNRYEVCMTGTRNELIRLIYFEQFPQYFKKLPDHLTAQSTTQGSILLQSWLKLHAPHQQVVFDR